MDLSFRQPDPSSESKDFRSEETCCMMSWTGESSISSNVGAPSSNAIRVMI